MRWLTVLGVALRRLRQRPVRTVLLLQGTIWGVAVAIFPSAVIQGTREAAQTQGASLGADRISVCADPTASAQTVLGPADLGVVERALAEARMPMRALGGVRVARVLPAPDGASQAPAATVLEGTPGAEAARGLVLAAGRVLRAGDGPERCVVEARVGAWLGRPGLAPGDRIRPPGWPRELQVVGVCAARSAEVRRTNDLGFDLEHALYRKMGAPLLLAMGIPLVRDEWKRSDLCLYVPPPPGATPELDWLFVRVEPRQVSSAAGVVRDALSAQDKAAVTLYPLVLPFVLGDQMDRFGAVNLAMFLACLLMGSVVMMNLGLLSALTRSREIAIRRTEGATRRDVATQFVLEGVVLAALGAGLGCLLGMALAALRASLEPVAGFTWTFPAREASWAVAAALVVGMLASLLPALRASRQDPVRGLAGD